MQSNKRVGVVPVAARTVSLVNDGHRRVGLTCYNIREGHPGGPAANNKIIGIDLLFTHAATCSLRLYQWVNQTRQWLD